ncbi:MAG: hypothetical protein FJ054_13025 [Cyanobacteria bacterium M_surface_10_m2_119]|nr:hypothetical protein [Cyanobacteria bacterium M_surface_10_m2_119]
MTRSEYVSTLPPWRRLLATLNWRPVYDIEQETERLRIESLESEKRTKQLESEFEQRELERDKRLKQLEIENRRLAELESRMDALLLSADSTSQTPPATGSN